MSEEARSPEFSRVVSTARLTGTPAVHRIEANAEERGALAHRFNLLELPRLEAEVALRRLPGGHVRLDATLLAKVVQPCVVTLDPVPSTVGEEFRLVYSPDVPTAMEDVLIAGDEDIVEPLVGETIDIGEAVAQQLSLALDPYPRAAGAAPALQGIAEPETILSPFAALAKLRRPERE